MKKRTVALLLAAVLVIGIAAGGTVAWLVDNSGTVTNTFTVGDINIDLEETGVNNATDNTKDYDYVPGDTLEKDPWATVEAGSEKCYLFVRIDEINNYIEMGEDDQIVHWSVAEGWSSCGERRQNNDGSYSYYYYRVVDKDDSKDQEFYILTNNQVTVNTGVTKEMHDNGSVTGDNKPVLKFTAAAVQYDHIVDGDDTDTDIWNDALAQTPDAFKNDTTTAADTTGGTTTEGGDTGAAA